MGLTQDQRDVVTTDKRRVMVVAGPGSGKTRCLVARVAYLIQQGADPSSIMVMTFTVKAAREVGDRLSEMLQDSGEGVRLGTFHSTALGILQEEHTAIGFKNSISIYDKDDAKALLEWTARDLGLMKGNSWRGLTKTQVTGYFNAATAGDPIRGIPKTRLQDCETLWNEYQSRLRDANALDFDTVMARTVRLLREDEQIRTAWTGKIQHLLVDEAQDMNAKQHELMGLLSEHATLFAVGDPGQSIFSWRGARPDLLKSIGDVMVIRDCFRCGTGILEAAKRLAERNGAGPHQELRSRSEHAGEFDVVEGRTENVHEAVRDAMADGYSASDIAILGRTHKILARAATSLQLDGIPYQVSRIDLDKEGEKIAKAFLCCLRLVDNPLDAIAFHILRDWFGLTKTKYGKLKIAAAENSQSLFQAYGGKSEIATAIRESWPGDPAQIAIARFAEVLAPLYDGDQQDVMVIGELLIQKFHNVTVHEALGVWASADDADNLADENVVTISTIHAAKGLEWPYVLMVGVNDGSFPIRRAIDADDLDEERRLFYVGMTRAIERLVFQFRAGEDPEWPGEPSRFLREASILG